jgi:ATP-dependent DNA ligase
MDLAVAAMRLPPGVILDGVAVVYLADDDGSAQISFAAAQSRAFSGPCRARELAARHPATYVACDALAHPAADFPDLRPRPYVERRQAFLDVLARVGPPIEPVWSTTYQGPADQQRDHRSANDARCCHLVPS